MLPEKDLLILSHLRSNARKSLTDISKETGIPISTVFDRLHALEKGIIDRHASLINFKKLGLDVRVHIAINAQKEDEKEFREHLLRSYNVNSAYKTDDFGNFLIEAVFKDENRLNDFLEELKRFNISFRRIYNLTEEIKRECFLALR